MQLPRIGDLLVAAADLQDPNFAGSVVLIVDLDEEGALGIVLNQATPLLVADALPQWADLASEPGRLHRGGPVGVDGALALGWLRESGSEPVGWQQIVGDLGLVDLDTPVEVMEGVLVAFRVFVGYAGWGSGQLESEIAEESWYVVPCEVGDAFVEAIEELRRHVLRRQPGELAWASTRPADPGLN